MCRYNAAQIRTTIRVYILMFVSIRGALGIYEFSTAMWYTSLYCIWTYPAGRIIRCAELLKIGRKVGMDNIMFALGQQSHHTRRKHFADCSTCSEHSLQVSFALFKSLGNSQGFGQDQ